MNLKKRVVKFYEKNFEKGKKFIAKHFLDEGIPKTTVYRHISCAEAGESGEKKRKRSTPKNSYKKQYKHVVQII